MKTRPWRPLILVMVVLGLAAAWMLIDASRRREAHGEHAAIVSATVRLLGTADLALSSSSRWLRHPSLTESGAAFADGPAILDVDPGGAMIAPPLPVLAAGERGVLDKHFHEVIP